MEKNMWNKEHLCGRRENLETWDVWRFQSTAFILRRSIFFTSTSIARHISLFGLGHSRFSFSPLRLTFFVDRFSSLAFGRCFFHHPHATKRTLSDPTTTWIDIHCIKQWRWRRVRYTLFRLWNECAQVALLTLERSHHKNTDELKKKNKANRLLNKLTARTRTNEMKMKKTTRRKRNEE